MSNDQVVKVHKVYLLSLSKLNHECHRKTPNLPRLVGRISIVHNVQRWSCIPLNSKPDNSRRSVLTNPVTKVDRNLYGDFVSEGNHNLTGMSVEVAFDGGGVDDGKEIGQHGSASIHSVARADPTNSASSKGVYVNAAEAASEQALSQPAFNSMRMGSRADSLPCDYLVIRETVIELESNT